MDVRLIFGFGALMSLASYSVIAKFYAWPWLRSRARDQALVSLVAPHMIIRFLGLSFLVPGVVSPALPRAFAFPAAYGDVVAGILAIAATIALAKHKSWDIAAVWVFNVWGAVDLLFAFYSAAHTQLQPGMLGAAFYLPTNIVPALLVTHLLVFRVLFRNEPS